MATEKNNFYRPKNGNKVDKCKHSIWKFLFWLYVTVLFVVVIIKFNGSVSEIADRIASYKDNREVGIQNMNLMPFKSIEVQLKHITNWWALRNLMGNIVSFIPYGFLLPIAYKKYHKLWKLLLLALASIVGIEVFQFVTMLGTFDVDDIFLNFIGVIIGYIVFFGLKQYTLKYKKHI